jgi:two-component system cell cycle sensor histidine kinase/response regulator CckA
VSDQVEQLEMKAEAKWSALSNSPAGKIIVVDDEPELKNILVEALSAQGFDVAGFGSGHQALEELRQRDFDLLLTDLMMPEMDGTALLEAALRIDPQLIGIIMTGQGTIQTAVDAMKVGAFDYVLKPFQLQTVMPALTRAIGTRRLRMENLQLRETVGIFSLCQTIAFTLDPQTVISKLADAALQQTDADEVSVLLPASDGSDELYVAAVRGQHREKLLGEQVPLEESISGWVAREREPLMLEGEINDDRFRSLWPHPEIRSAISIPMEVGSKLVGTININAVSRLRPFTLGQMKALTILAGTAAAALESASLYTQAQQAEEKYRSIFENAVDGIFRATPDATRFISVNPVMAQMFGYESPAEMVKAVVDIAQQLGVRPERRDEALHRLSEQGVLENFEALVRRKDGSQIWTSANVRAVRDGKGEFEYLDGIVQDITGRKHAEKEQARLTAILQATTDMVASADLKGFVQYINRAGRKMLGLGEDEDVTSTRIPDYHPEWATSIVTNVGIPAAIERGFWSGETALLSRDGREIPLSQVIIAHPAPDGTIEYLSTIGRDITERKRTEAAVRESEERYRDLVENAHDIIFSHDLLGNYTSVNRAGEQITGYTHEECLALNITDTIAPEHVNKARYMMAKKLAGENVTAYEVDLLAKDGKRIAVEVNTKLVLQDGVPVAVQGIARDVTERKQLEEQLRQSQKMDAIGQLAGGVAHDFNNLLTAINGYSSLGLQRIEGNPTVKNYLEEIKKAGDRAANLTRQLLAFGRKQILQPLPLSLNDIITDMNKMLRRLIGEDIQLSAKLTPDLKRVKADPGQIEQVLVNLVVNARDAMPKGGSLTIETANAELGREYASTHAGVNAGAFVVLAVSDTGTGMDEEVRRHIFEPFFTTKEKGKGTGLGLSTVYGIVKQSGGNISIYSEPNHGTTFKVYLPALDSIVKSSEARAEESVILRGSETVLLVEDEEVVRGLARQILEEAGYQVLVAPQGEEAVRLCNEHAQEIHLLLTDIVMPGAGGKEVADRLSLLHPGIKVLFMSGYTDEAIVHHGVLDSDVKFIQKPFTPAALARKVREVLDSELVMSD